MIIVSIAPTSATKASTEAEHTAIDSFYDLANDTNSQANIPSLRQYVVSGQWQEHHYERVQFERRLRTMVDKLPTYTIETLCHVCLPLLENAVDGDSLLLRTELNTYLKTSKSAKEEEAQLTAQRDHLRQLEPSIDEELAALQGELEKEEAESAALERERFKLEEDLQSLDERESLLRKLNQVMHSMQLTLNDIETEKSTITRLETTHKTLSAIRVYDDAFHIDVLSPVPMINGFALGVESGKQQPDWKSINEALGQCTFVLSRLISWTKGRLEDPTLHQQFHSARKYQLVPRGAKASIDELNANGKVSLKRYPLFIEKDPGVSAGSFMFGWVWTKEKTGFDKGLEGLLSLLSVVCDFVMFVGAQPPPYTITGDTIFDPKRQAEKFSIVLTDNTYDKWTQALRYMLCNIQHILRWYDTENRANVKVIDDVPIPRQ